MQRNTMRRTFFLIIGVVLLTSSFLLSCVSINSHMKYVNRDSDKTPDDAFVYVEVQHKTSPGICLASEKYEECVEIIKSLPPIIKKGSGSGMLVWAKHKPIYLTAAHVCVENVPNIFDQDGIKFTIDQKVKIRVLDSSGVYANTSIIALDEDADLCALRVNKLRTAPVKISHRPPKVGDVVYAISAPYGIHSPSMTLVFSGHYSGHDKKWNYYTIPTRPGSSGSAVLNENYRVVGMLNAAFLHIEHIGLGASHQEIVLFVNKVSKILEENTEKN